MKEITTSSGNLRETCFRDALDALADPYDEAALRRQAPLRRRAPPPSRRSVCKILCFLAAWSFNGSSISRKGEGGETFDKMKGASQLSLRGDMTLGIVALRRVPKPFLRTPF